MPAPALIMLILVALSSRETFAQASARRPASEGAELTLVRVNITTETRGNSVSVVINGKRLSYSPKIIHVFPSTGVVMDEKGHVLTFLGYRWVDLQPGPLPRIDIVTQQGEKYNGRLIGIDQNIGVAVVQSLEGKLRKTPICEGCPVKDGITIVAPVLQDAGISQYQQAQIVSIGHDHESQTPDFWTIKINRPLPGVGEPLLDVEHRVLGFVSNQKQSADDPLGENTILYHPMSQILASAEKILKAGGDIRTGWLGIFVDDVGVPTGTGITIANIQEDSPAKKAGLRPGDVLIKYDGKEVREARRFIRLVQDTPIGSKIPLQVLRNGEPLNMLALIEARKPAENAGRFVFNFPDVIPLTASEDSQGIATAGGQELRVGIETVPVPSPLAEFLQIPGRTGLLVLSVEPQNSFGQAGVQAGDVILAIDGQRLQSTQSFLSLLKAKGKSASSLILRLFRKGSERDTTIQWPFYADPKRKP